MVMLSKRPARPPKQLVALITAITVVPLATLLWLGWRLLEQDRVLERQQIQQRVERGADLAVSALQRAIAATEHDLISGKDDWGPHAVAVTFRNQAAEAPRGSVAFLPAVPPLREAPSTTFAQGEDFEFRQRNLSAAIGTFREHAVSADPAVRAGALLRLGRSLQKAGRFQEALATYARLSTHDTIAIDGVPAGLVGTYATGRLLEQQQRSSELRTLASNFDRDLRAGRWALTAPVYWVYSRDATRWTGAGSVTRPSEMFAEAIGMLWERWYSARGWAGAPSGRETINVSGHALTALWQTSNESVRVLVAGSTFVESRWIAAVTPIAGEQQVSIAMGSTGDTAAYLANRRAFDSALPWNLTIASVQPPPETSAFALRRQLLGSGFLLLVLMALMASYLIVRAVARELAVARMQSDFIAAVSHEFRTPLTALRQFTDMLRDQPALNPERRQVAYDAQSRATDRLSRLVETILDFGRMEAGAYQYQFEQRDCSDLVRRVVDEFRGEAQAAGHALVFRGNGAATIHTDEGALSTAVRNLLDNAVKYSLKPQTVEVDLRCTGANVLISVHDTGIGIPSHEQRDVFTKFHRGEQARVKGIKGTGLGLAMVREIIQAHHGRIELQSEPGKGSTFTIVLPLRS